MRSVLGFVHVVALVAVVSLGCEGPASSGGGSAAPGAPNVSMAPAAPSAAGSAAAATLTAAERKIITVTTKSSEAKTAALKGLDLLDNGRRQEALVECKKAVAEDADFALGHACVGWLTDGAAGQADLDKAAELAAKLPDAEKLFIEALAGQRHADLAKYVGNLRKVAELAPDDFRAHAWAGRALALKRDFAGAEAAYKKTLELNTDASFAYAALSRAQSQIHKYDEALSSAKKYAEAAPNEPAAQQSLAAAFLNLDRKKEADEALSKAVTLGPKVLSARYDLAIVKTLQGEFPAAKASLEKSKAAQSQPDDDIDLGINLAWVSFAEGKDADAMKQLAITEKEAEKDKLPYGWAPTLARARALWILGKPADSLKAADTGVGKCDSQPESSSVEKSLCRIGFIAVKAFDQISLGKGADAMKTAAQYKEEARKLPDVGWVQVTSEVLADEATALDKKDTKAARPLLAKVLPDDALSKLSIFRMAEQDGDKATAEQIKSDLLARPLKDVTYPLISKVVKEKN